MVLTCLHLPIWGGIFVVPPSINIHKAKLKALFKHMFDMFDVLCLKCNCLWCWSIKQTWFTLSRGELDAARHKIHSMIPILPGSVDTFNRYGNPNAVFLHSFWCFLSSWNNMEVSQVIREVSQIQHEMSEVLKPMVLRIPHGWSWLAPPPSRSSDMLSRRWPRDDAETGCRRLCGPGWELNTFPWGSVPVLTMHGLNGSPLAIWEM